MRVNGSNLPTVAPMELPVGSALSGAEQLMVEISRQLDESGLQERASRRLERKVRSRQKEQAIDERRSAATFQLAGTLVQAGGKLSSSALSMRGGDAGRRRGEVAQGTAELGAGLLRDQAAAAQADGERHDLAATEASERAEDDTEAFQRSLRFAEKALEHATQVADARVRAMQSIRI